MFRSVALFAVIAATVLQSEAAIANRSIPVGEEMPGFTFLGSSGNTRKRTNYWISHNEADYPKASQDCDNNNAALVQLENGVEKRQFEKYLAFSGSDVSEVWVGGRCDTQTHLFVWDDETQISGTVWINEVCEDENERLVGLIKGRKVEFDSDAADNLKRFVCERS